MLFSVYHVFYICKYFIAVFYISNILIDRSYMAGYTTLMNNTEQRVQELAKKAYELGFSYEKTYRGCAQGTLAALQDATGIKDDQLFRSASSLASGGGLTCAGSCGGFSAGLMFIGSLLGRRREHFDNDNEFKYLSFELGRKLHDKFIETYGTVICSEIHRKLFGRTYDLYDAIDKQQFNDDGAHADKCTSVVAQAAAWTIELVYDELHQRNLLD
jgi:hypothetical protein